jgi:hypothetical protein
MSANALPAETTATAVNTTNPRTATRSLDDPDDKRGATCVTVQSNIETKSPTEVTARLSPLLQAGNLPIKSDAPVGPVADSQAEMSQSLDHAQELVDAMETWEGAVGVIKQVMDLVGPITRVGIPIIGFIYPSITRLPLYSCSPLQRQHGTCSQKFLRCVSLSCQRTWNSHFFILPLGSATPVQA